MPSFAKIYGSKEKVKQSHDSLITTHRYMLMMDEERLKEFDVCIIDEDIFFKSLITSQYEIPLSSLKNCLARHTISTFAKKLKNCYSTQR